MLRLCRCAHFESVRQRSTNILHIYFAKCPFRSDALCFPGRFRIALSACQPQCTKDSYWSSTAFANTNTPQHIKYYRQLDARRDDALEAYIYIYLYIDCSHLHHHHHNIGYLMRASPTCELYTHNRFCLRARCLSTTMLALTSVHHLWCYKNMLASTARTPRAHLAHHQSVLHIYIYKYASECVRTHSAAAATERGWKSIIYGIERARVFKYCAKQHPIDRVHHQAKCHWTTRPTGRAQANDLGGSAPIFCVIYWVLGVYLCKFFADTPHLSSRSRLWGG